MSTNAYVRVIGDYNDEQLKMMGAFRVGTGKSVDIPINYIQDCILDDGRWVCIVSELIRPGMQTFTTKLEYTYFPVYCSSLAKGMVSGVMRWDGLRQLPHIIAIFPRFYLKRVNKLAKECGLALTKGVNVSYYRGKPYKMPIKGKNIYRATSTTEEIKNIFDVAFLGDGDTIVRSELESLLNTDATDSVKFLRSKGVYEVELVNDVITY